MSLPLPNSKLEVSAAHLSISTPTGSDSNTPYSPTSPYTSKTSLPLIYLNVVLLNKGFILFSSCFYQVFAMF